MRRLLPLLPKLGVRRVLALGAMASALVASGCDHGVALLVENVSATRIVSNDQNNGKIQVDVEVRASEQGGGAIGNYCVSVFWFAPGVNPAAVPVALTYPFNPSRVLCSDGGNEPGVRLEDGDRRVVRFLSNEPNLVPGQPLRAQANVGTIIDSKDVSSP